MTLGIIFLVIFIALTFEYINGFHDTANSIATVVGTKVLTPRQAIALAACTNLIGALADLGAGRFAVCLAIGDHLRADGRYRLEFDYLVVWYAVEFHARAGRRNLRCGICQCP